VERGDQAAESRTVIVTGDRPAETDQGALAVFRNRPFLLLWLSQAATQIGGNMVLFGLTVIVSSAGPNTAVSLLILTFLVPAVLFSAFAGVFVDRVDRRTILVATNLIRAAGILVLNAFVSTVNVFFTPAEGAMIPVVVPRDQLISANGIFTLTLNAAFAVGFALLGPLVVTVAGPQALILVVAALFLVAAMFCRTLPAAPPTTTGRVSALQTVADAERSMESVFAQLREGIDYIRGHRGISWSLIYLGITASVVGVLGVLGPDFARDTLGLQPKDFVVVVLPLGAGIVMGILLLNSYGRYLPRRRVIEVGLISLGLLLSILSIAGPLSRFLQQAEQTSALIDLSAVTSLLAVVVVIAFFAGISYGIVAIPAQTQLQEELPEDVRGRVFGVLNMLASVSSFLPIIVVGPISDVIGTTAVIFGSAILIMVSGILSVIRRGPLALAETRSTAETMVPGMTVDPVGFVTRSETLRRRRAAEEAETARLDLGPDPADDDLEALVAEAELTGADEDELTADAEAELTAVDEDDRPPARRVGVASTDPREPGLRSVEDDADDGRP
jgi:MFS family permease